MILGAVVRKCSVKKVFLEISENSHEKTFARVSFLINCRPKAYNFTKKQPLAQVFSCEFSETFKNLFIWNTSAGCFCDFYVESDTILLAHVFENFCNNCIEMYEFDPPHFFQHQD